MHNKTSARTATRTADAKSINTDKVSNWWYVVGFFGGTATAMFFWWFVYPPLIALFY